MPGPVSDSYDPVWGTGENASVVLDGIREMDAKLTEILNNSPPQYILDVIRNKEGEKIQIELFEYQVRVLRYVCRVALGEEDI